MNLCVCVCVWGGHNSAQSNVNVPKPEQRNDLGEIRAPWGALAGGQDCSACIAVLTSSASEWDVFGDRAFTRGN